MHLSNMNSLPQVIWFARRRQQHRVMEIISFDQLFLKLRDPWYPDNSASLFKSWTPEKSCPLISQVGNPVMPVDRHKAT